MGNLQRACLQMSICLFAAAAVIAGLGLFLASL